MDASDGPARAGMDDHDPGATLPIGPASRHFRVQGAGDYRYASCEECGVRGAEIVQGSSGGQVVREWHLSECPALSTS
jgi:hypothetical protein